MWTAEFWQPLASRMRIEDYATKASIWITGVSAAEKRFFERGQSRRVECWIRRLMNISTLIFNYNVQVGQRSGIVSGTNNTGTH